VCLALYVYELVGAVPAAGKASGGPATDDLGSAAS
jgi:hypothetical protein